MKRPSPAAPKGRTPLLRNRRGIVFLIIALLAIGIFLTILFSRTRPTETERAESIVARISSMDDFLKDFHADVHRATYISGFRTLIALEEYINEKGSFLTNVSPKFIEAFLNGTIDGKSYDILTNSTFSDYLGRVNEDAAKIGVALNVTIEAITLSQSTPWSVDVTFSLGVNVTDTRGLARWDYVKPFTTEVSILDLRDPVYSVATYGRLPNTFRVSPFNNTDFVKGNDTTNLSAEALQMYYREDPYAPSFLQRLNGSLNSSSKYGIASIVNLDEINAQGLAVYTTRSVIDAVYFSGRNTTNYCPTNGSPRPSWLKIDSTHYNDPKHDYEISKLNATTC
jgi:hypothetical protein